MMFLHRRKSCTKHGHVWVARPNASPLLWEHCSRIGCHAVTVAGWVPDFMWEQVYRELSEEDRCEREE